MYRMILGCRVKGTVVLLALLFTIGGAGQEGQPPHGKSEKIVFARATVDFAVSGIFIMNADGSGQTMLIKEGGSLKLAPALSPDGKQIVITVYGSAEENGIWVMNADGSKLKQLTKTGVEAVKCSPYWSPDGRQLVYSTHVSKPQDQSSIYIVDADGKNAKKVGQGLMPAWSPDGKQILYTSFEMINRKDFKASLHVMDADGKNPRQLVKAMSMMGAWSPDGKRIVYVASSDATRFQPRLFVMNADGSAQIQLTKGEKVIEVAPRFSADGKRIYFNRVVSEPGFPTSIPIYVIDADGTNSKQLTKNDTADMLGSDPILTLLSILLSRDEKPPDKEP